ncbi:MAG: alpha/beta hydrolase [Planctomycetes bacterium]|nr:alpha/beta hydrolase [Planctomycetota bacterium]
MLRARIKNVSPTARFLWAALLLLPGGCALENSLIYQPSQYPRGTWSPPGLKVEDAHFASADGTKLHGWYVSHPRPRAVVLFAHGNAGNLSDRWPVVRLLNERLGVSVLAFDYRGYGRSEGQPNERGILADARAARDWLARREGIAPEDVVLLGRSLGGGVMVDLAARDGARGLILESTFTSLPDVAAKQFPWLPVGWIMHNRLDSLSKIGDYQGPLLQSHGAADQLIPLKDGRRLHAAAPGRKRFVTIPDADHNWVWTPEYVAALNDFLLSLPSPRSGDSAPSRHAYPQAGRANGS